MNLIINTMFYQLFIRNENFKRVQISCDTWNEVLEEVAKRSPKFAEVEYYNSDGLVGIAWKYRSFSDGLYKTYKKLKRR